MIEIVSATRSSSADFGVKCPLGQSLSHLASDGRVTWNITFNNERGLPQVYNSRIEATQSEILIFVHDDVWLDDPSLTDHVLEGLSTFDIIGLAGNRRRALNQPSWAFPDDNFTLDDRANLSGAVAHGDCPRGTIDDYGDAPAECELLDGVFLAARKETLVRNSVYFDPQFDFHFYDLDFCRTARNAGLRLGTWPIPITHRSGGSFDSPYWKSMRDTYRAKWKS